MSTRLPAPRRYFWACACGNPGRAGMRSGPQYVAFEGAEYARELHATCCRDWSVVIEAPVRAPRPR